MLEKHSENRNQLEMVTVEMLVPEGHLLRKIEMSVDFNYIYELVEKNYDLEVGRPSCDPVVIFKIVLLQHLYGIKSLRQTLREIEMLYRLPLY